MTPLGLRDACSSGVFERARTFGEIPGFPVAAPPNCLSSPLFPGSLSVSVRLSPGENWGFAVYRERRECQTQKTNERATNGAAGGEQRGEGNTSPDLEARRVSLLSFLLLFVSFLSSFLFVSFPSFLLSLPSPVSFLDSPHAPIRGVRWVPHSWKKHFSSISVSTSTRPERAAPTLGPLFLASYRRRPINFATERKENNGSRSRRSPRVCRRLF